MDPNSFANNAHDVFEDAVNAQTNNDNDIHNDFEMSSPQLADTHAPATDSQAQHQRLTDVQMDELDFDDIPPLQEVTDSSDDEQDSDGESDRDAYEVEMQAVDTEVGGGASFFAQSSHMSTSQPPVTSLPRTNSNRRARVDDDEDEDRDRRHPSQRISSAGNNDSYAGPSFSSIPQTTTQAQASVSPSPSSVPNPQPQTPQIQHHIFHATLGIPRNGNGGNNQPFRFFQHMMPPGNNTGTNANNNTNPGSAEGAPPAPPQTQGDNPQQQRGPTDFLEGFTLSFDLSRGPNVPPTFQAVPQSATAGTQQPQGNDTDNANQAPPPVDMTEIMSRIGAFGRALSLGLGIAGGIGGFGFGLEGEKDDPERAKKLVEGLEDVPVGLVRRLERVGGTGGGMGEDETKGGDGGCAICWDRLLDAEGEGFGKGEAVVLEPSGQPEEDAGSAKAAPQQPRIVSLPCAHVFHADCLIPWFSRPRQTTCPTCRFNIDPENLTYISWHRRMREQRAREREAASAARAAAGETADAGPSSRHSSEGPLTDDDDDDDDFPDLVMPDPEFVFNGNPQQMPGPGGTAAPGGPHPATAQNIQGQTGVPIPILIPVRADVMAPTPPISTDTNVPPPTNGPHTQNPAMPGDYSRLLSRLFGQTEQLPLDGFFALGRNNTQQQQEGQPQDQNANAVPENLHNIPWRAIDPSNALSNIDLDTFAIPTDTPLGLLTQSGPPSQGVEAFILPPSAGPPVASQPRIPGANFMGMDAFTLTPQASDQPHDPAGPAPPSTSTDDAPPTETAPGNIAPGMRAEVVQFNVDMVIGGLPPSNNPADAAAPATNPANTDSTDAPPPQVRALPTPSPANFIRAMLSNLQANQEIREEDYRLVEQHAREISERIGQLAAAVRQAGQQPQQGPPEPQSTTNLNPNDNPNNDASPNPSPHQVPPGAPFLVGGIEFGNGIQFAGSNTLDETFQQLFTRIPGQAGNQTQDQAQPEADGQPPGAPGASPPGEARHPPQGLTGLVDFLTMFGGPRPPRGNSEGDQPRTKKAWVLPPAPGPTLRQRIERREREAGLRCYDVSCGIGPSDEDPLASELEAATKTKQLFIKMREADGEKVCLHTFHPACLVSAERVALRGTDAVEEHGNMEVSCPVCRGTGCVSKEEWAEGVHSLQ